MTDTLAQQIITRATQQGLMIATAESCTGGLIIGALTDIAGSSAVVDRGFITYSNEAKQQMIDVKATSLETHGAVSEVVAKEMAFGALTHSKADITVAVTGIAGPGGGSAQKPVGTVCFALAVMGEAPTSETITFENKGRDFIRQETVNHALGMILARLYRVIQSANFME